MRWSARATKAANSLRQSLIASSVSDASRRVRVRQRFTLSEHHLARAVLVHGAINTMRLIAD
jgi:hypothetical protein